jgi:inward rectifier potassium channel
LNNAIDPGLGEKFSGKTKRVINPDGTFNVKRMNVSFSPKDLYLLLLQMSWPKFFFTLFMGYFVTNVIFAVLYYLNDLHNLSNAVSGDNWLSFMNAFFFSSQTLTTVGYGGITPHGLTANIISALEAMTGLLGFALATGLLFGRFSRPSARILFSRNAIVTPYRNGQAVMFRIANQRHNTLMEMEAKVLAMFVDPETMNRKYMDMELERNSVYFFPLSWTIVHPITENSPFFNKSEAELEKLQAEILILIKGFDETFSQVVHARYSYRHEELLWNVRFRKAFSTDSKGEIIFDLEDLHAVEPLN